MINVRPPSSSFIQVAVWGTFAALVLRILVFGLTLLKSDSLFPTFPPQSLLLFSRLSFHLQLPFSRYIMVTWAKPSPLSLVAFENPGHHNSLHVSRVAANEEQMIEIKEGNLIIDNVVTPFAYPIPLSVNLNLVMIPKGHFFVLNDNLENLDDSRSFGPIPYSCLQGKIQLKIF